MLQPLVFKSSFSKLALKGRQRKGVEQQSDPLCGDWKKKGISCCHARSRGHDRVWDTLIGVVKKLKVLQWAPTVPQHAPAMQPRHNSFRFSTIFFQIVVVVLLAFEVGGGFLPSGWFLIPMSSNDQFSAPFQQKHQNDPTHTCESGLPLNQTEKRKVNRVEFVGEEMITMEELFWLVLCCFQRFSDSPQRNHPQRQLIHKRAHRLLQTLLVHTVRNVRQRKIQRCSHSTPLLARRNFVTKHKPFTDQRWILAKIRGKASIPSKAILPFGDESSTKGNSLFLFRFLDRQTFLLFLFFFQKPKNTRNGSNSSAHQVTRN